MAVVFYGFEQTRTAREETPAGRVVTVSTYRMPDNLLLREQKDTYMAAPLGGGFTGLGMALNKSDVKVCDVEASVYGPNGPINQAKPRGDITRSYAWVSDAGASAKWVEIARTENTYGYDTFTRQAAMQTTTKYTRQARATGGFGLVPDTMTTKTSRDVATNMVTTTTDNFTWDATAGKWVSNPAASGDHAVGGGKRAGGIRSGGG